ncbi:hypothetical protein ATO6_19320 [Oceanicola sp. 22II-s10i]|nr:hypothetical protein ATO6_19320 [Oceanicola sp. 22II-s10i]
MFPALERMFLEAEHEICLSFRIFDARTMLRSDEAKALELKTWADLMAHVSGKGVKVRMLLADFDPIFAGDLHREAWASARIFACRLSDDAELICAMHECKSAPMWKWIFRKPVADRIEELKRIPDETRTPFQNRAIKGDWELRPVTLHQKLAVADGKTAIIGGLDVDERRWDTQDHDQRQDETWHDVSVLVQGPVTRAIRAHFAECWKRGMECGGTVFTEKVSPVEDAGSVPTPNLPAPRVLRTLSCRGNATIQLGAKPELKEHEEAHIAAFDRAKRSIYIETQFFRHAPIARALARAAKRETELELVLLMPTEPERIIIDGQEGFDSRHAQALQIRCLDICRRAFGDRMTVVSPAQPRPAKEGERLPVKGASIVYVHSKVTLVDDHTGIVGSANLNGRSMRWDTEASIMFHGAEDVADLRNRLAKIWLSDHLGQSDPRRAAVWEKAAQRNAKLEPEDRIGFIMPYPEKRNRRFARFMPILPPEMF